MHDFLIGFSERFWVDMQPFLFHRGYRLRPRYDSEWQPSWLQVGSQQNQQTYYPFNFEDSLHSAGGMLDAIRIEDNQKVVFKKVDTNGEELVIAQFLSSEEMRRDPRNCAVPILDVILIPGDDDHALIVMPHLLPFDVLPFRRLGEFCEMALQLLEGLEVMHEQNIAHRDACWGNLMMDHSKVVPKGTHFRKWNSHDGVNEDLDWKNRWDVRPVQYFIIDFGISLRCPSKNVKVPGYKAQDTTAPELSRAVLVPYDPFPLDIYHLGNAFNRCIKVYDGLEAFQDLAGHMTEKDPNKRPTAAKAVSLCKDLIAKLEKSGKMTSWVWRHTTKTTTALDFFEKLAVMSGMTRNLMN